MPREMKDKRIEKKENCVILALTEDSFIDWINTLPPEEGLKVLSGLTGEDIVGFVESKRKRLGDTFLRWSFSGYSDYDNIDKICIDFYRGETEVEIAWRKRLKAIAEEKKEGNKIKDLDRAEKALVKLQAKVEKLRASSN